MGTLLFFSFLPVFIILGYTWLRDSEQPEPWTKLLGSFFAGAATTVPILVFGYPSIDGFLKEGIWREVFDSIFYAAIPEEFLKIAVFYLLVWRSRYFDERLDGIVYAVFISIGFAAVENLLYVLNYGMTTAILRMFLSVPGHAIFAIIMGYYLSLAKFNKSTRYHVYAYVFPVIFHAAFNIIASLAGAVSVVPWFYFLFMALLVFMQIRIWKHYNKKIAILVEADNRDYIWRIIEENEKLKTVRVKKD
jgi:protease PrsW